MLQFVKFVRKTCIRLKPEVIHCHSFPSLFPAFLYKLQFPATLIYDAHELESGRSGQSWVAGKLVAFLEAIAWRRIDGVISVSDSILAWYSAKFGIKESQVIKNIPDLRTDCLHHHDELRSIYSIPRDYLISVYVGILEPNRGVRLLLKSFQVVQEAGRKHALVFLGQGSLDNEIGQVQGEGSLIFHHGLVAPECIVPSIRSADIGLIFTRNDGISEEYALPNKLFQYVGAGLHVVGNDLEGLREAIGDRPGGSLIEYSSEALSDWLRSNEVMPASKKFNPGDLGDWEAEEEKLLRFYLKLTRQAIDTATGSDQKF